MNKATATNPITEGNKLIARFMGYEYFPSPDILLDFPGWRKCNAKFIHAKISFTGEVGERMYLGRSHNDLRFYNSWNWLMPVVDKIKEIDNQSGEGFYPDGIKDGLEIFGYGIMAPRNLVYEAVIQFIEWYNGAHL